MLKKSKNSDELKTHREMYVAHCAKFGGLELPAGIHYTAGWNDASEILDAVVSLCQESDAAAVKRADEIERLKTELREISEAIDDPAINLTKTTVECINDLKLRIRLAEGCAARNQETTHICMNNIVALKEELDTARNGFIEWDAEHIKTGSIYRVVGEALDATNMLRGMHMVIYRREGKTFVRESSEFMSKFRAAKGQA